MKSYKTSAASSSSIVLSTRHESENLTLNEGEIFLAQKRRSLSLFRIHHDDDEFQGGEEREHILCEFFYREAIFYHQRQCPYVMSRLMEKLRVLSRISRGTKEVMKFSDNEKTLSNRWNCVEKLCKNCNLRRKKKRKRNSRLLIT